jgi:hypothetical protein
MQTNDKCPICAKSFSDGFAYIYLGTSIDVEILNKHHLTDAIMETSCHIGYHGSDPNSLDSAGHCVAEAIVGGQFEKQFCSLSCLRQWFSDIIDQIEMTIDWKKKHQTFTEDEERETANWMNEMQRKGLIRDSEDTEDSDSMKE